MFNARDCKKEDNEKLLKISGFLNTSDSKVSGPNMRLSKSRVRTLAIKTNNPANTRKYPNSLSDRLY